jgi:hypothetical protein
MGLAYLLGSGFEGGFQAEGGVYNLKIEAFSSKVPNGLGDSPEGDGEAEAAHRLLDWHPQIPCWALIEMLKDV